MMITYKVTLVDWSERMPDEEIELVRTDTYIPNYLHRNGKLYVYQAHRELELLYSLVPDQDFIQL